MDIVGLFRLLTVILMLLGFTYCIVKMKHLNAFKPSIRRLKINLMPKEEFLAVIMAVNTWTKKFQN